MNTADNKRTLGYVAGACFALHVILSFVYYDLDRLQFFDIQDILNNVAFLLIGAGLFIKKQKVSAAGVGMMIIMVIYNFVMYFVGLDDLLFFYAEIGYTGGEIGIQIGDSLLNYVLLLATYGSLLMASLRSNSAKKFGLVAGVITVTRILLTIIYSLLIGTPFIDAIVNLFRDRYMFLILMILWAVGNVLLGMVFDDRPVSFNMSGLSKPAKEETGNSKPSSAKTSSTKAVNDQVERLARLKTLLDNQVITQEEFEEKKKQILG